MTSWLTKRTADVPAWAFLVGAAAVVLFALALARPDYFAALATLTVAGGAIALFVWWLTRVPPPSTLTPAPSTQGHVVTTPTAVAATDARVLEMLVHETKRGAFWRGFLVAALLVGMLAFYAGVRTAAEIQCEQLAQISGGMVQCGGP